MNVKITKKRHFNKYIHKVTVKVISEHIWKYNGASRSSQFTASVCHYVIKNEYPNADIRIRNSRVMLKPRSRKTTEVITFYFNESDILDKLETVFSGSIIEIEKPRDANHAQVLLDISIKTITRSQLWFKKYRFVCKTGTIANENGKWSLDHVADMKTWAKEQLGSPYRNERYKITGHYNYNFYFATIDDLIMFKMVFGSFIASTETIKLLREIDETPAADALELCEDLTDF